MRKIFFTILFLFATETFAQQINIEKAQETATEFMRSVRNRQEPSHKKMLKSSPKLVLSYTAKEGDKALYYIFNDTEGGFVVTSGDERAEQILAYSDKGNLDIETANPNLRFWLKEYENRISETIRRDLTPKIKTVAESVKKDVPILIQTHWGQDLPYNKAIRSTTSKSYPTGCVATAMSQVMKYHEWPESGTGSHSYYDSEYSRRSYTRNFEHPYNWGNMLNDYLNETYSSIQADAVAELMFDTGVSVNMEYDLQGSGTYTEQVPYAMVHNFGYDEGIAHAYRDYYTDEEWEEMIYTELAEGRPVLYGGCTSNDEGHEFICDGYQANTDKYHFNWGWDGAGDCYCTLSAVKYSSYLFKNYQDIVYGIQKPCGNKGKLNIILFDDCFLESKTIENEGYITYKLTFDKRNNGIIWNDSYLGGDVVFNMMYENQKTGKSYLATPLNMAANKIHFEGVYVESKLLEDYPGYTNITVNDVKIPELPSGDYRIYLVYKNWEDRNDSSVEWQKVRSFLSEKNYLEEVVESKLEIPVALEAKDVKQDGFTASWAAVEEAESYSISLASQKKESETIQVLDETFATLESERTDGLSDIGTRLDLYTTEKGWKGDKIFSSSGRVRLGTQVVGGILETPTLRSDGKVTVIMDEKICENDSALVTVEMGQQKSTFLAEGKQHTIEFQAEGEFHVKILTKGRQQRVYIDQVKILVEDYDRNCTVFENLTDTEYTFSALDPTYEYSYQVRTHAKDDESKWSNEIFVVLQEGEDKIMELDQHSVKVHYESTGWVIKGLPESTIVSIYTPNGILIGQSMSGNGTAYISSSGQKEGIVILKIGRKTIKCLCP